MTTTDTQKKPTTRRKPTARKPVPPPPTSTDAAGPLAALVGDLPSGLRMVDVDRLVPHPRNPRTDLGDLTELVDSIRVHGVRQNLTVVPDPGEEGRHLIVIGHRRAAAARLAGLTQVPASLDPDLTEAEQLELMLVENMQRTDLTVVEEATGYQGLLDLGLTQKQMAKATGVSPSKVSARLKVARLPEPAKAKLHTGQATLDDAAKLEEFAHDPEVHARLVDALGSADFHHDVAHEHYQAERKKQLTVDLEALAARGVEVTTESPDYRQWAYEASDVAAYLEAHADVPVKDLLAWDRSNLGSAAGLWLYVRNAPEIAAEWDDTGDAEVAAAEEAAEEEAAKRVREARDQMVADLGAAVLARRAFLLPLCRGERALNPEQVDALTRHVMAVALRGQQRLIAQVGQVAEWLGVYDPDDEDADAPVGADLITPSITTGRLYLAHAAVGHEWRPVAIPAGTPAWDSAYRAARMFDLTEPLAWCGTDGTGAVAAWYAVLAQLGYQPSAWERDRLAGVPLIDDDTPEQVAS